MSSIPRKLSVDSFLSFKKTFRFTCCSNLNININKVLPGLMKLEWRLYRMDYFKTSHDNSTVHCKCTNSRVYTQLTQFTVYSLQFTHSFFSAERTIKCESIVGARKTGDNTQRLRVVYFFLFFCFGVL